jgi:hypothetical protein
MSRASRIAARTIAGYVTATEGNVSSVNAFGNAATRSIRSTIDSPPCGAWAGSASHRTSAGVLALNRLSEPGSHQLDIWCIRD